MRTRFLLTFSVALFIQAQQDPMDLLRHVKARIAESLDRLPRFMCSESIRRTVYERDVPGRGTTCDEGLARPSIHPISSDQLRLDVAISSTVEMYSWVGESRFNDRDLRDMVQEGAISNGAFADFLSAIFRSGAPSFTYTGEKTVDDGTLVEFAFRVPYEKSTYPNNENFCGYGTGLQCIAFLWHDGVFTALPALGGTNAGWGGINNRGELAGYAETSTRDPDCRPGVAVNGTGPQVLDFEPVIWGPDPGQIRTLSPLPGNKVGVAFSINDNGQAVGMSGLCSNTVLPGLAGGPHAVLWEVDGSVQDLGTLGGTIDPNVLGDGTVAFAINNQGQVTGQASLPGNQTFHPFLWTRETGMQDLGVVHGDLIAAGLAMNNRGQVVGASISAPGLAGGNSRAALWQGGAQPLDLNTVIPSDSPLYLAVAFSINDSGEIAGVGATSTGDIHGYVATPGRGGSVRTSGAAADSVIKPPVLSDEAKRALQQAWPYGRIGGRVGRQR